MPAGYVVLARKFKILASSLQTEAERHAWRVFNGQPGYLYHMTTQ